MAEKPSRDDGEEMRDDDGTSGSESEEPEFLATTRARRSRAGALMSSLINEEADDDLALLFAEQDDDEEFEEEDEDEEEGQAEGEAGDEDEGGAGNEDADDMQVEESSGDEDEQDKGADAGGEEFSGEAEIERQAKAERMAKKRKERDGMRIAGLQRKKVKIDPTAQLKPPSTTPAGRTPTIPPPRPRKKSERISWLPTSEDGPLRSSSRRQTMQNKELTHARLKDNAQRRERQIRTMKQAAEQKAKAKPKQMTQADRLAEAAKTERLNSKSLNRWEEMEKKRSEEQRAKLAALHSRRLDGAVATWWSGIAKWVNDRLAQVGQKTYTQANEAEVKRKKAKAEKKGVQEGDGAKPAEVLNDTAPADLEKLQEQPATESQNQLEKPPEQASEQVSEKQSSQQASAADTSAPETKPTETAGEGSQSVLGGIHLYASMNEGTEPTPATAPAQAPDSTQPETTAEPLPPAPDSTQTETTAQPLPPAPDPTQAETTAQLLPAPSLAAEPDTKDTLQPSEQPNLPTEPSIPAKTEISSRNCVVLEHFDTLPAQSRGEYGIFFNPRKPQKLQKTHHELCPITSLPARHRDPQTGLAYANARAYREIRQLVMNRYAWSGMLGCFVGPVGVGARGVPERFLLPNAAPPPPPPTGLQTAGSTSGISATSTPAATPGATAVSTPVASGGEQQQK